MLMSLLFLTQVPEVLGQGSNFREILWNFSRFRDGRRLTLKENPHFYNYSDLPISQKKYTAGFKTDPINDFQLEHTKICVLTDKPGRVFLETDKNTRAFGNFWEPNNAIILKGSSNTICISPLFTAFLDICGKLARKYCSEFYAKRIQFLVSRGASILPYIPAFNSHQPP